MSLPTKHILQQGPVIASLGGTALAALRQSLEKNHFLVGAGLAPRPRGPAMVPGPEYSATVPPLPADLVRDYIRHVGGDPAGYRGVVPAHLFPQWGFPLAARTLRDVPYPLARALNGGCRLEMKGDLPLGEPLEVTAQLVSIDDNGRRAVLEQKVVTGTKANRELVVGHFFAIVPLGGGDQSKKGGGKPVDKADKKPPARVPDDATEVAYWRIPGDAGLAFAMLTGDFNPVHWIKPYAKAFGFRSTILHGFSTMARTIEGLNRGLFSGATRRLATFDCRFTRPLVLPARVGLYQKDGERGGEVWVGDAPGGPAYLVGNYTLRETN